jgi:NDP-sugar pyrophosphorylase family protein
LNTPFSSLVRYGIRDIIINLHHWAINSNYLATASNWLANHLFQRTRTVGYGRWPAKAKPFLQDGTFIVINTDVLIDLSLTTSLLSRKKRPCNLGFAAGSAGRSVRSMESMATDEFADFSRHGSPLNFPVPTTKLMFTGVQVLEPRVFDYMAPMMPCESSAQPRIPIPRMLMHQEKLFVFASAVFGRTWERRPDKSSGDSLAAEKPASLSRIGFPPDKRYLKTICPSSIHTEASRAVCKF